MNEYSISYTKQASLDLLSIVDYIESSLYAPFTAERFYYGIRKKIENLRKSADIYKISHQQTIRQYGSSARRINYKGFAIIYTIEDSNVIIHRIIHGSLLI